MQTDAGDRGLEIATAFALGLVSVVTALGALQAGLWTAEAGRFASDAADARDQSISLSVTAQLKARSDFGSTLEAQLYAVRQDAAFAAEDLDLMVDMEIGIQNALGTAYAIPEGAFEAWREGGFVEDENPTRSPEYVLVNRGGVDALILTSQRLSALADELTTRAAIYGQAALVHALALFLFGVAGINRLRTARTVVLIMGAGVFAFGLLLMSMAL